jgi:transposase InsO family protein
VSSPHNPQTNGKAESTIKSMKQLIKAAWKGHSVDQDILACSIAD